MPEELNLAPSPQKHYPFLDGFRGIAILWVLLQHAMYFLSLDSLLIAPFQFLSYVFRWGFLGVDMFFVISGFLITGLLIGDLNNKVRLKRFYLRRFFKIVPQYLVVVIVGLLLTIFVYPLFRDSITTKAVLGYLFFFQNYVTGGPNILGHTWSLAIEEQFYLLWPLFMLVVCFRERKEDRRLLLIVICVVLIATVNYLRYSIGQLDTEYVLTRLLNFRQRTHYKVDALIFGCLLKLLEPYYSNGRYHWRVVAKFCMIIGLSIYTWFFVNGVHSDLWYTNTLSYLAAGSLMFAAYHGYQVFVDQQWLRWIGKNSYAIYLWHFLVIYPFMSFLALLPTLVVNVLYLITAIGVGFFSTVTIERFFLNLRKEIAP